MSIRSPDGALTSEPCLDESFPDFSFFTPTQAVNIAKWSEDVSGAASSQPDLFCLSPILDMGAAEAFELKHDTASVYSMDSAYQSQTSSGRRAPSMPEGYQSITTQDNRSRVNSHFLGSDNYSPTLSSENFNAFTEQHSELNHMQLPSAGGDMESGENAFYANYTTGQDYAQYTATSVPRFTPTSALDMGYPWSVADAQAFNNFNFNPYPRSANSMDTGFFQNQEPSEITFNAPAAIQRHLSKPRLDTSVRPAAMRATSSFSTQHSLRRPSTQDTNFGAFVMSPASAMSAHLPSAAPSEFDPHVAEAMNDKDEVASTSLAAQSLDDDELLSPADAAEAKTMEEEQGKLARSDPLYNAQPDEDGKYHCPNEGKAGCNHKPTPLKCNYDKYVDSHLKPFRCNKKVCVGVQFSSTACLLRHEREAHGMHGHGSRPHLCHFNDCERSVPGNGFPRRYNLFDHMKRVHDYTGPTTEPSPPAPAARSKPATRKRKSTSDEGMERRQKVAKLTPQQQLQIRRNQLQESFLSKKQNIIDILSKLGGPNDLSNDIQLTKEVVGLHEISDEYKKMLGG